MRATLSFFLLAILSVSAMAQNAISNGSFQSGSLNGWTAAGSVSVSGTYPVSAGAQGNDVAVFDPSAGPTGTISQTFSVTPGQPYELSFAFGTAMPGLDESLTVTLTDTSGNQPVITNFNWRLYGTNYYRTCTAVFVPATSTMTITFKDMTPANTTQKGLLDNVQVSQIPAFSKPGAYAGSDVETISYAGAASVVSRRLSVKADIDSAGRMLILLAPIYDYTLGTINDQGEVTLGGDNDFHGTAAFHGNDIVFNVTEEASAGENFNYSTLVRTRKYTLHKVASP